MKCRSFEHLPAAGHFQGPAYSAEGVKALDGTQAADGDFIAVALPESEDE
jgi:hypothetical protein